jgi:hypothetical protein
MPVPPGMSPKDANQVLRAVMDDTENRLRVDAIISPDGTDLEIHYQDDSIAIGDPSSDNILAINSDGSINVHAVISPTAPGTAINIYNEVTGIAISSSTTVVTYTVPVGKKLSITRVEFSSDSVSTFELDFSGSPAAKKRLTFTNFNGDFDFENMQDGLSLTAGTIINVVATNNSVQGAAEFAANIQGVLI